MSMIPEKELRIERLSSLHDISDFDSGNEELNDFLKNDSIRDQKNLISKTHLYQNAGFRFMERQASKQYPRMYLNVCKIIEKIRQRDSSI